MTRSFMTKRFLLKKKTEHVCPTCADWWPRYQDVHYFRLKEMREKKGVFEELLASRSTTRRSLTFRRWDAKQAELDLLKLERDAYDAPLFLGGVQNEIDWILKQPLNEFHSCRKPSKY